MGSQQVRGQAWGNRQL